VAHLPTGLPRGPPRPCTPNSGTSQQPFQKAKFALQRKVKSAAFICVFSVFEKATRSVASKRASLDEPKREDVGKMFVEPMRASERKNTNRERMP
jgi:hypothetical protein